MRCLSSALSLILLLCGPAFGPAWADDGGQITVTGEGRVDGTPDLASITLGVTTEARTAAEAMAKNSAQLATVLDRLKAAGIAPRDLQTTGLSLNPVWQNHDSGAAPTITGYSATNMLTVRVRVLDNLGSVLDAAVTDGANTFNGLAFGLSDPAPAMNEARKRAVADAMARAALLTGAAGVTLGDVISITEGGGYTAPAPAFRMDAAMSEAPVPVAGGEVSTSAMVTMVFALED